MKIGVFALASDLVQEAAGLQLSCEWVPVFGRGRVGPWVVHRTKAAKPSFNAPAPIAHQARRCAGYSVYDEFAHGADPTPVWRNTEGRRVSWLNLVMVSYPVHCLQSLTASGCAPFWRANIDRKRQIWPAGCCGLHYVRPHYHRILRAPINSKRKQSKRVAWNSTTPPKGNNKTFR